MFGLGLELCGLVNIAWFQLRLSKCHPNPDRSLQLAPEIEQ